MYRRKYRRRRWWRWGRDSRNGAWSSERAGNPQTQYTHNGLECRRGKGAWNKKSKRYQSVWTARSYYRCICWWYRGPDPSILSNYLLTVEYYSQNFEEAKSREIASYAPREVDTTIPGWVKKTRMTCLSLVWSLELSPPYHQTVG